MHLYLVGGRERWISRRPQRTVHIILGAFVFVEGGGGRRKLDSWCLDTTLNIITLWTGVGVRRGSLVTLQRISFEKITGGL